MDNSAGAPMEEEQQPNNPPQTFPGSANMAFREQTTNGGGMSDSSPFSFMAQQGQQQNGQPATGFNAQTNNPSTAEGFGPANGQGPPESNGGPSTDGVSGTGHDGSGNGPTGSNGAGNAENVNSGGDSNTGEASNGAANDGTGDGGTGNGEGEGRAPPPEGQIDIVLQDSGGELTFFRIKRKTLLRKVFNSYIAQKGGGPMSLRFLYDGERLSGMETPETLQMNNGDKIDVILEQFGGY